MNLSFLISRTPRLSLAIAASARYKALWTCKSDRAVYSRFTFTSALLTTLCTLSSHPPQSRFKLTSGSLEEMTEYVFNKGIIKHYFCPACGLGMFGWGKGIVAVNVRCVEGIDVGRSELMKVDGKSVILGWTYINLIDIYIIYSGMHATRTTSDISALRDMNMFYPIWRRRMKTQ